MARGKRNPYRVFETVGEAVGIIFAIALTLALLVACPIGVMWAAWGWWAILAAPIFWAMIAFISGIFYAFEKLGAWISGRWNHARYEWDKKQRETSWP